MKKKFHQDPFFQNLYCCCSVGHEGQEIIGFCMLYECQFTSAFCIRCINQDRAKFHIGHQESYCLGFKDIYQNLKEGIVEFKKDVKILEQLIKSFQECQNQLKKLLINNSKNDCARKIEGILKKTYYIFEMIGKKIECFKKSKKQLLQQNHTQFRDKNKITFLKKTFKLLRENYQLKCLTQINNKQSKLFSQLDNSIKKLLALQYFSKGLKMCQYLCKQESLQNALSLFDQALIKNPQLSLAQICKGYVVKELAKFQIASTIDEKNNENKQNIFGEQHYQFIICQIQTLEQAVIRQSNNEDAINFLNEIIRANPNHALSYCIKGYLLDAQNDNESVIECFDYAIRLDPKNSYFCNSKGIFLHQFGKYDQSHKQFDEAIKLSPNNPIFYINKAISLTQFGRYDDSIINFNQAISLEATYQSSNSAFNLKIIQQYINDMNNLAKEQKIYKIPLLSNTGILLKPEDADIYRTKGDQLRNQGEYHHAILHYDVAIRLKPDFDAAYNNKGYTLELQKHYDDAIKCYDEAIKLNSTEVVYYINKGNSLQELDKHQEAINCYDEAISVKPNNFVAYNNKGCSLNELKQFEDAIKCYDQAIIIEPTYGLAYNNKGNTLQELQQHSYAIECYNEVLKFGSSAKAYNNKGFSLYELKEYLDAIMCYDQGIRLDPQIRLNSEQAYNYQDKTVTLQQLQIFKEALICRRIAIYLNPKLFDPEKIIAVRVKL